MFDKLKTDFFKRYIESSLITFVATFLLLAVPQLLSTGFNWSKETVVAVVLVAIRAAVKAVWDIVAPLLANLLQKNQG